MAQVILDCYDNWVLIDRRKEEREWREEERKWRMEDMEYRMIERKYKLEEVEFKKFKRRMRKMDIQQRVVDNSQYLWIRNKQLNTIQVEEKAEHMRMMSWITSLIAGFTMTAPVEFSFNLSLPPWGLVTAFAIFTAIVPGLMTIAAMMSVCLLGGILKMGKKFVNENEEEVFMRRCQCFYQSPALYPSPPTPSRTFDRFWETICENDWINIFRLFSTGITVFFFVLGTMAYIKFFPNHYIPLLFISILLISLFYWFRVQYYWGTYLTLSRKPLKKEPVAELEERRIRNNTPFDWHIRPRNYNSISFPRDQIA